MKNDIQYLLLNIIKGALESLQLETEGLGEIYMDFPSDSRFGDLSTNVPLRLSRLLKKTPLGIAKEIVIAISKILETSPLKRYVSDVKAEGAGFINFYLSESYFQTCLLDLVKLKKDALRQTANKDRNVLIEFVSANPTGPLSVAHARQAAVGDALANIFEFLGFNVKREYYLNDEGNQINILGNSIELRVKELSGEKIDFPDNYYQGEYIFDIAKEISQKELPAGNFSELGVEYLLEVIKKELSDFGVRFDYWYSQKKLRESGKIDEALNFLKGKGYLYEKDGALWFQSTRFGDDKDRVVIKSDGSYTYLAPDIAYHRDKYERGFDYLINFMGPDHHGYISRLKAAVEALGYNPQSLSVIIVQLATIFRDGKPLLMSTRRGQYITLREVIDEVGLDAARFFFLMRRTSSHLDFDLTVAKKQTPENPVYYCQYAYARICSILRNSATGFDPLNVDLGVLKEDEEIALMKKLWQFHPIITVCANAHDPYMVTVYLQELAELFHKFYDTHRVLGQDEKIMQARLALIEGSKIVIGAGLELLGVSRPEKM